MDLPLLNQESGQHTQQSHGMSWSNNRSLRSLQASPSSPIDCDDSPRHSSPRLSQYGNPRHWHSLQTSGGSLGLFARQHEVCYKHVIQPCRNFPNHFLLPLAPTPNLIRPTDLATFNSHHNHHHRHHQVWDIITGYVEVNHFYHLRLREDSSLPFIALITTRKSYNVRIITDQTKPGVPTAAITSRRHAFPIIRLGHRTPSNSTRRVA